MDIRESERIEFKREVNERICKTIVAFANSSGGTIYIGIDDFGNVLGIDDVDGAMLKVSNWVHDLICPELMQFVHISPVELEGKTVVLVDVEAGDEKPYYLASKGLVPAGVFTRLGPATVPMSRRDIRRMIRDTDCDPFDSRHAKQQDLTFNEAARIFASKHIDFDEARYDALGIRAQDGFYSNLALLISDQNPYTLKCATFNDDAGTEFLNRLECTGSILRQYEEALAFLRSANNLRAYFPSHTRVDQRDYPDDAIREGLLNAIIHRDYDEGLHTPTLIKMYRAELAFVSYGTLFEVSVQAALGHESHPRNPRLLALFHRLGEVEAYGSGLPMIWKLYHCEELTPRLETSEHCTTLVLPNINTTNNPYLSRTRNDGPSLRGGHEAFDELASMGALPARVKEEYDRECRRRAEDIRRQHTRESSEQREREARDTHRAAPGQEQGAMRVRVRSTIPEQELSHVKRFLISFAIERNGFSREEAQEALGANRDATLKVINGLIEEGKLEKTGRARATRYHAVAG